ncbi:quaternary amine ABC transporter ATP-binding protein [Salinicoccus roseus]|uniref:quaternary amine ABC transporter ATP-binding protein n=1 Tax=Salinicoccus roseus TaxID=45670 RepID=UPI000FB62D4D|nr:glycine betaine/L-proline ABC transporter ATP-binding protein [Salinicoccus roseus]RPE51913.1 glycine betaine/proline transport system ATP-binding protein [Salinicoccus roseus]GGA75082.1 glycine/betaine ABC transporter ATP-binding protein [Salinicoccus roseus]
MSVIEVSNMTKVFGQYDDKVKNLLEEGKSKTEILSETGSTVAVKSVDFSIDEGEVFVVMGLSGSGKSTLIRLINRLIEPSTGTITIHGQNVSEMGKEELREFRRKNFSMVFQNFALFPFKTVLENAAFGLEVKDVPKSERLEKAQSALSLVGLDGYEHQYPSQLSGGMQQRVGLARALANDTDILLMDEAFSALDPLIRKEMQQELVHIQKDMKKTIIFITHDLDEALNIGDKIALMKDGEIAQIGTPVDIITSPADDYVRSFVKDINHAKVLRIKHLMDTTGDAAAYSPEDAIESHELLTESFNYFKEGAEVIAVKEDDKVVGTLSSRAVYKVLAEGSGVGADD